MPRPWRLAFDAPADLPALRHVLLGINAHVNYDLPQALLAVITDDDFADPVLMASASARPRADRRRALRPGRGRGRRAGRALGPHPARPGAPAAEPDRLQAVPARGAAEGLAQHRRAPERPPRRRQTAYDARLAELEVLSAARIADLLAPGQVLLRLAVAGFGVVLPPPAQG